MCPRFPEIHLDCVLRLAAFVESVEMSVAMGGVDTRDLRCFTGVGFVVQDSGELIRCIEVRRCPNEYEVAALTKGSNALLCGVRHLLFVTAAQNYMGVRVIPEQMATNQPERRARNEMQQYIVRASQAGYNDALYTDVEGARRILTERRMEIIELLSRERVESVRDLARRLDRQVSVVSEDLTVLSEEQVIEYEHNGQRKIPVLKHPHIFVKPLLLNGEAQ